jgi:simple sugar transport system ATP-binding protein
VIASPTRGLDVAAIETVHRYLREAASNGVGVLLISEDLDELFELSDRIAVMHQGRVAGVVDPATTDRYEIGQLMLRGEVAA